MPEERFDTAGFVFFLKLIVGIVFLIAMASLGTSVFADRALAPDEDEVPVEHADESGAPTGFATYIPKRGKFIGVDLSTMTLYLYENSEELATFTILAAGRTGTEWEVHEGLFGVSTTAEDYITSIESIRLPWAVGVGEEQFIHGWPYGESGAPVGEASDAGYLRLATEDAERVYEFAEEGIPVFVRGADSEHRRELAPLEVYDRAVPATTARAYLVADIETGEVLAAKNERLRRAIASVTKLMTAITAREELVYNRNVMVPSVGRRYLVDDLYYPLFLRSDNEVAEAIARHQSRAVFLAAMNAKARELKMRNTRFVDASGLSAKNVSTVSDLFELAKYLYTEAPELLEISRTREATIQSLDGVRWSMGNQNQFAKTDYFVGGKLGFTSAALQTSLGIYHVEIAGEERTVAVIILGSHDWKEDTRRLLAWTERAVSIAGDN